MTKLLNDSKSSIEVSNANQKVFECKKSSWPIEVNALRLTVPKNGEADCCRTSYDFPLHLSIVPCC